jgi:hypothetical protein
MVGEMGLLMLSKRYMRVLRDFRWSRDLVNIHFIRTQRRYNKRRYARMRAVSRPSF